MPRGSRKEADSQIVKERQVSRDKAKIAVGDPDDFLIPRMRSHLAWQFPFPWAVTVSLQYILLDIGARLSSVLSIKKKELVINLNQAHWFIANVYLRARHVVQLEQILLD